MNKLIIAIASVSITLIIIFVAAKLGHVCLPGCACNKKESYDGPSLAFDPSTRASIAGIGPIDLRTYSVRTPIPSTEGFCQSCL